MYDGLTYKLALDFPDSYPFSPPKMTFVTPCWHPNVDGAGNICLDVLSGEAWSAALTVATLLLTVQGLLGDANPASPLNTDAAALWHDPATYRATLLAKNAHARD